MKRRLLLALPATALTVAALSAQAHGTVGIDLLPARAVSRIDALVAAATTECRFLNIGVVLDGKIVLTKSYGDGRLKGEYEYASVSKPVTSTIVMQLRDEGLIKSLDDEVRTYLPQYSDAMPDAYKHSRLTVKHLLTHRSGIPHNDEPPILGGKFNLKFEPGTRMLYSTPGYGILGKVVEAVTGMTYSDAVRKYIGGRAGAPSFRADPSFIAPGAYVFSTIEDMARFGIGVMSGRYVRPDVLYREVLRPETGNYGYGWSVSNVGTDDLTAAHSGSNGLPRAYILLEPHPKDAVVILAQLKTFAPLEVDTLAKAALKAAKGDE